ncbi:hypothetical protein DWQ65_04135 [Treponema phagedenis]|uniref:Uncharacterized protein n=1 Tax=Treponema phagedenis TaxID=162 RepID=A0AAE6IUD1_TREPH|nr:hypothetical protein FUT82_08780 [Treponema phagedenis]QEK03586.1 hypothetical protein FUT83_07070 [Treponema phagedenis]QEK09206.1 hypothetical protein FUT81_06990 [Treponema phagedenis]QSH99263.1 hypothetical protein DWQ65_04135 [Treponema phagedenis]
MVSYSPLRRVELIFVTGSFKTRKVKFCHGRQNSERARTPVVPCRSDVLKQSNLPSFKTRRLSF